MANGASIPPWMNIDPLRGIPFYLQGFGQGAQVGESQRRSEQVAYEQSLQQAAQQERNQLLREAKQIQAQEFAETLKLKQDEAKQAAAEAAIQLEGQHGLEKDLQSGLSFQQAFPKWAPKILYKHPQSLTQVMENLQPPKNILPQTTTVGGVDVIYNPATGAFQRKKETAVTPTSLTAIPISDEQGNLLGYGRPGPQGSVIPLPASTTAEKRHPLQTELDKKRAELEGTKVGPFAKTNVPTLEAEVKELERIIAAETPSKAKKQQQQQTPETPPSKDTVAVLPLPAKAEDRKENQPYLVRDKKSGKQKIVVIRGGQAIVVE